MGLLARFFSKDKALLSSLANILGFYPSNINLYKSALRHRSAATEIKNGIKNSNERLEYLGDAVLQLTLEQGPHMAYLLNHRFEAGQPFADRRKYRGIGVQHGLLRHISQTEVLLKLKHAIVQLLMTSQYLEQ